MQPEVGGIHQSQDLGTESSILCNKGGNSADGNIFIITAIDEFDKYMR